MLLKVLHANTNCDFLRYGNNVHYSRPYLIMKAPAPVPNTCWEVLLKVAL